MQEIVITYILGYFITFLACSIYSILGFRDLDSFIQSHCIYIIIIYYIFVIIYLFCHNRRQEKKINAIDVFPCIFFGVSFAILFNMIIFYFNTIHFQFENNIPLYLVFISSGIVGPIYEEFLFRYVFFQRLKKKYSLKKSIVISSLVFGIIHLHFMKCIYAFIFGIFLSYIYNKNDNIIYPILTHIAANSIVLFLFQFHPFVFGLSIVAFIISLYLIL